MLRLFVALLFLFSANNARADQCAAACRFVEEQTGETCEDVAAGLEEIEGYCGENQDCWIDSLVEAGEGEIGRGEAAEFLEKLFSFDCDV